MSNISCFIITKNEEKRIAKAINSVKLIADEIIVVDSGSTDNTVSIAENLGAKVIYNEWPGYLKQKIYGESLCRHDWVLNIDADEEVSTELQEEIDVISGTGLIEKYKAYKIKFVILHRKDEKPRNFAPSSDRFRLYNTKYASFAQNQGDSTHDDVKLHEGVDPKNDVYLFSGAAYHRSGGSIAQLVNKANFYSTEQATALNKKGRNFSNFRLLFEFPLWIIKAFFIRRYFVFGLDGFVDSVIFAFARFIRLAKLRELRRENNTTSQIKLD